VAQYRRPNKIISRYANKVKACQIGLSVLELPNPTQTFRICVVSFSGRSAVLRISTVRRNVYLSRERTLGLNFGEVKPYSKNER